MQYNKTIKEQLERWVETPAILVTQDDTPYEYRKNAGSIYRLKRRRYSNDIPYQLYSFIMENNISKSQVQEFASGLFLNYVETSNIYV